MHFLDLKNGDQQLFTYITRIMESLLFVCSKQGVKSLHKYIHCLVVKINNANVERLLVGMLLAPPNNRAHYNIRRQVL